MGDAAERSCDVRVTISLQLPCHIGHIAQQNGWNCTLIWLRLARNMAGIEMQGASRWLSIWPTRKTVWANVGTHGLCVRSRFNWQLTSKWVEKLFVLCWADAWTVRPYISATAFLYDKNIDKIEMRPSFWILNGCHSNYLCYFCR